MYFVDFFKHLFRKSNTTVIIYLFLNIFFVIGIFILMLGMEPLAGIIFGLLTYLISITIALSPLGEFILRYQTGCRKIKRVEQKNYLEPLFNEVYAKAKLAHPEIPDDILLYINDDEEPNAFATGRKTVCVTKGMMEMGPEEIKGCLAHEFGHIAHKDTDILLVITVGNMIFSALVFAIKLMMNLIFAVLRIGTLFTGGEDGFLAHLLVSISHWLVAITVNLLLWVWTKIGVMLCLSASRGNEYEADEFSFNLGYGNGLCTLLEDLGAGSAHAHGLFAVLSSSHPPIDDRIARIQELGADYRKSSGSNLNKSLIEPEVIKGPKDSIKIEPMRTNGLVESNNKTGMTTPPAVQKDNRKKVLTGTYTNWISRDTSDSEKEEIVKPVNNKEESDIFPVMPVIEEETENTEKVNLIKSEDTQEQSDKKEVMPMTEVATEGQKTVCPHCGTSLDAEDYFCPECGRRQRCASCGTRVQKDDHYCSECGAPIE